MLYVDCPTCYGTKAEYGIDFAGEPVVSYCRDCGGSGVKPFDCHEGCPPGDHTHDEEGDIVLPYQIEHNESGHSWWCTYEETCCEEIEPVGFWGGGMLGWPVGPQ